MKDIAKYLFESLGSINRTKENISLSDLKENKKVFDAFLNMKPNVEETIEFTYPGVNFSFNIKTKQGKSATVSMLEPQVGEEYSGAYNDCLSFMTRACETWIKNNHKK